MKKGIHGIILLSFICFLSHNLFGQGANRVDVGKSFANISKLNSGGTFNPGDTIEVRVTIAVIRQGTQTTIDSVQVFDVIPAGAVYINGSMRVATNQGLTYKGPFSENVDSDAGSKVGNNITINLGRYANGVRGGRIRSDSSKPSFFNTSAIMMAVYRVRISPTLTYGSTLTFTGGSVRYKMVVPMNGWTNHVFSPSRLHLFDNIGFCQNGAAVSATSDNNGTFGEGTTQNRAAALLFGTTYIKQNISTGQPQDYNYAIINNSSANGSTNPNSTMPESPALRRVFGFWDIAGDHTGATNPSAGNAPVTPGQRGGYFVLVNASYNTNIAYQETLNNLCPNTYYEFSAWIRNVCPRCSCDSNGRGSSSVGFIPYPGNDSSGVRPNLSFEVDGLAYYTTGDIRYDRSVPWKKYGFTFRTGPAQTFAQFAIRNNSPGGGGNDWAIDDITVAHCGPSLHMNYNPFVLGCAANPFVVYLRDTIRSVYNNYVHYKWQKSNVGGTVWNDMTGPGTSGVGTPTLVNGQWEYVTALPPFMATPADSGTYYRVIVATTATNLNSATCAYNDQSSTMIRVIDCGTVLAADIIQFQGRLRDEHTFLSWQTTQDESISYYDVERSEDGATFLPLSSIPSSRIANAQYTYTDPEIHNGLRYYRIKMYNNEGLYKYSNIIPISKKLELDISRLENPFTGRIQGRIISPIDGQASIRLLNTDGKQIQQWKKFLRKGSNDTDLELQTLPQGVYLITVEVNRQVVRRKLIRR